MGNCFRLSSFRRQELQLLPSRLLVGIRRTPGLVAPSQSFRQHLHEHRPMGSLSSRRTDWVLAGSAPRAFSALTVSRRLADGWSLLLHDVGEKISVLPSSALSSSGAGRGGVGCETDDRGARARGASAWVVGWAA